MKNLKDLYPEIAQLQVVDIINSEIFKEELKKVLFTYRPKPGRTYYAYLSLLKENILEIDNFIKEYLLCIDKQSKMPFIKRVVIYSIGNEAYAKSIKKMIKSK